MQKNGSQAIISGVLSSESQSHVCTKPSLKSICAIKCLIMLKEPLHSLVLAIPSGKHTVAFCLGYDLFKVFKCHESATVRPIRGAIAGSKHETQPILCHAGLTLQILVTSPKGSINQTPLSSWGWVRSIGCSILCQF